MTDLESVRRLAVLSTWLRNVTRVSAREGIQVCFAHASNLFHYSNKLKNKDFCSTSFISAQKTESWGLRLFQYLKTKVYFVRGDTDQFGMRWFRTISFTKWSRCIKLRILKVFFPPQFLVSNLVYEKTVIFIYLLSDKAANADFFQIQYLHVPFITPKLA